MQLIELNNSIVNMRKTAIKAKIHVIRQLVRHAKSIKSKKVTKEEQKAQNQRKIDRFQSEVHIIKHLKRDDISKFALQNKQSFLPEINPLKDSERMEELLRKRALVRLSNTSVMKKDIEGFRKKYPNWESELPKLLRILGQKQRQKAEKLKKKKKEEKKAKPVTKEDSDNDGSENDSDSQGEDSDAEDANISMDESSEPESEVENAKSLKKVPEKNEGEMKIKQLELKDLIEEDTDSDQDQTAVHKKVRPDSPKKPAKDSFFLGGGNDDESEQNESEDEDVETSIKSKMSNKRNDFFGSRGRFDAKRRGQAGFQSQRHKPYQSERNFNSRAPFEKQNSRQNSWAAKTNQHVGHSTQGRKPNFEAREEKLHPSWAAKRQQQPRITINPHSQSKKLTFDDPVEPGGSGGQTNQINLHPSWAAKKDNKKGIQQFEGKKVVFDDD